MVKVILIKGIKLPQKGIYHFGIYIFLNLKLVLVAKEEYLKILVMDVRKRYIFGKVVSILG
ncbi:hypothetical protein DRO51_04375 [Candidatus Bathyarchaeota archaeon]|nr:MAG: hypothetical protein DRO51_04375 [Candidatus Bathyarchaeota archaeon]